jgi:Tol biopolymer transport system component
VRGVGVALLLRPARKGERHDKTDALSTSAARDPGGCGVDDLCSGSVSGSERAEATFPGKNGRIAYASYVDRCRLCIVGYPGHDPEIYTINASGKDKIQLTRNNKNEFDLSYSPNGKRIVYASLPGLEDNAESDIYTINAVGSGKTQVTNTDNAHEIHPSWRSRP